MKHYFWTMGVALTAFTLTACSSEDELAQTETPVKQDNVVTLTATVLPKTSTTMRGLTDPNDGTLTAEWAEGEEILVHYIKSSEPVDGYAKGTVTSVDGNGNATITVDLTDAKEGDSQIDFYYPYSSANGDVDAYLDQIGTLADVSANYDQSMGSGTLTKSGGTATLPDGVAMQRINCVWKFTFTDGTNNITNQITKLEIYDGTGGGYPFTITPTTGLDVIYASLYGVVNTTITITAYTATDMYRIAKSGITLQNGKLYTSNNLALSKYELGKLIGADGKIYADADAAAAAGTTAVAKIVYLGEDTGEHTPYDHGLALALSDANNGSPRFWRDPKDDAGHTTKQLDADFEFEGGLQYNDETHDSDTYPAFKAAMANNGTAVPTGCSEWFLPSAYQLAQIINSYGVANLKTTAGGFTGLSSCYSSSEKDADKAWDVYFGDDAYWAAIDKNVSDYVRACLAF